MRHVIAEPRVVQHLLPAGCKTVARNPAARAPVPFIGLIPYHEFHAHTPPKAQRASRCAAGMSRTATTPRVALITGAARRVGKAIARELHQAGLCVAIHHHRSGVEAAALAEELESLRADSTLLVCADLLDAAARDELVPTVLRRWQRLDILVNNAARFYPVVLETLREADYREMLGVNLEAPLWLSSSAAPALRRARGCILNLTDIYARRPLPGYAIYCTTKAGLTGLTRALARELGPEIRVNAVAPGVVLWPEQRSEQERAELLTRVPMGRAGEPADIARAVRFLALEADYITGQVLTVDGGRELYC